ncbi:dihydroxyacetone kinase subunit L [Bosea beijingensis]|uniref:dihydroxyacetone kinase subunit L n=1 Tax=Bosea beijingensis TaxID=3068632 RepID=UPI0027405642|nr:DAK2 domain-containing protein [Bosea sp. REN20]
MAMDVASVAKALERAVVGLRQVEQELNVADGHLGDGDTGGMLRRLFERIAQDAPTEAPDLGAYFGAVAGTAAGATGSSLGTLVALGLSTMARRLAGQSESSYATLGDHLLAAVEKMQAAGGASLGDKTVLDALEAVANAIKGEDDPATLGTKAVVAAQSALDAFRPLRCKVGRARIYGEKSVGLDDPGMLAVARLTDHLSRS